MSDILNLLLADDDFDDAYFFKEAIQTLPKPLNIVVVRNGEELMRYLNEHTGKLPELLFMDLNMPLKNGFECLEEIKTNEKLKSLPVVIYTTSDQKEILEPLYKAGAQFFVQKPDNFPKLRSIVIKVIELAGKIGNVQPPQKDFVITA